MEIQTDNPREGYPFPCFSYDEGDSIVLNTAYIMCSDSVDVRYVLGILNSSVGRMIARLYTTQLQERQFRMLAQYLVNFPIAKASDDIEKEVIECVKANLTCGNAGSRIDQITYELYGLDATEIAYLENLAQ